MKKTCNDFVYGVAEFKLIADSFIEIFDAVSSEVEKEKMAAIGAQNLLQTSAKHREAQVQQLTALVSQSATWVYMGIQQNSYLPTYFACIAVVA